MQQLRDVLERIAECHLEMQSLYRRLHSNCDSARTRLMLEYLQQHQKHIADTIESYIDDAPKQMMDTWYENLEMGRFKQACEAIVPVASMTEDELLELHLKLDNRVLGYVEHLVEKAPTGEIESAMSDLLRVSKTQQHRLVHSVARMEDI
ncbi:MAG: hypothetical protein LPH19_05065 [Shewanella sp.]|nr:hypothetical protein [Shewanella sp.]MCF1430691.1 hypothetical protein [Shewanella sp.]